MVIGPESLNQGECECLPQKAAVRMKGVNTCNVLRIVPGTGEGLRDFIPSAAGSRAAPFGKYYQLYFKIHPERSHSQNTTLYEISRVGKSLETEGRLVAV